MKRTLLFLVVLLAGVSLSASTAECGVTVGFDIATLNRLLPSLAPAEVIVPLAEGNDLTIRVEGLRVTGFDPGLGPDGQILTSLRLVVPQFGLDVPLEPRLSLRVLDAGRLLELRFVEARLGLPLAGKIDIAPFMPPLSFPVEGLFVMEGVQGDVQVRSRLQDVRMGQKVIRFELDLAVIAAGR